MEFFDSTYSEYINRKLTTPQSVIKNKIKGGTALTVEEFESILSEAEEVVNKMDYGVKCKTLGRVLREGFLDKYIREKYGLIVKVKFEMYGIVTINFK